MSAAPETRAEWMARVYEPFRDNARREIFLRLAVYCYQNPPAGDCYLELGCHRARTMRAAWDAFHALFDFTYVAFDSFEGLPEVAGIDRHPLWQQGDLRTSEEDFVRTVVEHGMPREKLITVKGFYDQIPGPEIEARFLGRKAAVVYLDCDLYASAAPALEIALPFLARGTVLVFDDWFCFHGDPEKGERRAFREFRERHPELAFQEFFATSEIQAFICRGGAQG
jgi:O-methyltransferase